MSFHTWQNTTILKPQIRFNNIIKHTHKTKFLGVHLTKIMEWEVHIKYLSSKLGKCYYIIQFLKGIKLQIPSGEQTSLHI